MKHSREDFAIIHVTVCDITPFRVAISLFQYSLLKKHKGEGRTLSVVNLYTDILRTKRMDSYIKIKLSLKDKTIN
jgi:hypothetical protein